jgi:multiple sugar transport system permease protein
MKSVAVGRPLEAPSQAGPARTLVEEGRRLGLLMTLPAQLLLLFIVIFPLFMQIYISMTYWGPTDGVDWVYAYRSANWFDNYVSFFSDGELLSSVLRTLGIMTVAVPLEFVFGFGLAILFLETFPGKRIFYSILLTPMMVVPAVAGYMFFMLFQSNGPVNQILSAISGTRIEWVWLSVPDLAFAAVIIVDIWQWTPLMFLILLAGILAVPEDQLTAAMMLGASWYQRFRRIILPRMKAVIAIALVLRLVEAFKLFDVMFVMTRGGPGARLQMKTRRRQSLLRQHPRSPLRPRWSALDRRCCGRKPWQERMSNCSSMQETSSARGRSGIPRTAFSTGSTARGRRFIGMIRATLR